MASPAKRMRLSAQRQSMDGRKSLSGSAPPAPRTALRASISGGNRHATAHTSNYDIITGEPIEPIKNRRLSQSQIQPPPQPSQSLRRSTSRTSMLPKPEQPVAVVSQQKHQDDIIALQAQLHKLEYEKTNLISERDMQVLQHEKDLREAQSRTDVEHRRYQEAESERLKAVRQVEAAVKEARDARDNGVNDRASLDRKLRDLQSQNETLREEKEDLEAKLTDADREMRRIMVDEVQGNKTRLEQDLAEAQAELEETKSRFAVVNAKLEERNKQNEELEAKVMDLSSKAAGGDELGVLKKELSEQIAYVRRLEIQTREQNVELRKLRDERKSVNMVQEEKRALEVQLQVQKEVERKLGELEIQKEILEDEKRMWTSLLEKEGESGQQEFDTPEAVVRALVNERIEHAMAIERLGREESENMGKDEVIRALQSEQGALKLELAKARESTAAPSANDDSAEGKAIKRIERQRQLAQKEIEYLRAQLETFNAEETTMMDNKNFDNQRAEQVTQLTSLVDQYKAEIQSLHNRIATFESSPSPATPTLNPPTGSKRPAPSEDLDADDQLGPVLRKNKNLQVALQKSQLTLKQLAQELQASRSQLKALRESSKTRVLELHDNPTAQHEAIKASTLRTLKSENAELMARLRGEDLSGLRVVPVASLDALKLDLKAMESVVADKDKRMRRQREIWTEKAAEFRDVVASILGYRVHFLPNGKVKVSSMYYKSEGGEGEEVDEDDREDYILFDGEKGTMKTGGGSDGEFGREVAELVEFWIRDRKEIPCFLAAMTLEFYEKFGTLNA